MMGLPPLPEQAYHIIQPPSARIFLKSYLLWIVNTTVHITAPSIFVFLGVFQGTVLSLFFMIKKSPNAAANRFQGLLLLTLSLCILEQFLNMTGLIVRVLPVTNASEPLNLVIGPFLYLYVKRSIRQGGSKKEWVHFILAIAYLGYMFLEYIQPNEFKYNSYVGSYHPDWPRLDAVITIPVDPLDIKQFLNPVTALQMLFYISMSFLRIHKSASQSGSSFFTTEDDILKSLRNTVLHILIIVVIFVAVKAVFEGDLGDYFIGMYIAVFALLTTFRVMNDSTYFDRTASFMDITIGKYRKSSLTEDGKKRVLEGIKHEFESKNYFENNLASLSELAKRLGESPHHVSQVINEKLNRNFFELLAHYRVEKAKKIISGDKDNKLTIEEISEMVGYNSKTAFNNAFRKITGKTPSEFRNK
jgi:AraC-like DNA-binding protein